MKRKRHTPEQIIGKLREADAMRDLPEPWAGSRRAVGLVGAGPRQGVEGEDPQELSPEHCIVFVTRRWCVVTVRDRRPQGEMDDAWALDRRKDGYGGVERRATGAGCQAIQQCRGRGLVCLRFRPGGRRQSQVHRRRGH